MKEKEFNFFESAQAVVRLIPQGRVTSYGAIASYLSSAKAARMVGYAMRASANDASVPAHRVLNRVGMLSGKSGFDTPNKMQLLLEKEGIKVKDNQVENFQEVFWDPAVALKMD